MLKKNFLIALANAGITQAEWARRFKISRQSLCRFLAGQMTSKRLALAVQRFIAQEFKKLNLTVSR